MPYRGQHGASDIPGGVNIPEIGELILPWGRRAGLNGMVAAICNMRRLGYRHEHGCVRSAVVKKAL